MQKNLLIRLLIIIAIGILVNIPDSKAQLLENRGKLKTANREYRGFFHFLRKKNKTSEQQGSKFGKKPDVQYSPTPKPAGLFQRLFNPAYQDRSPMFSPPGDRQFNGGSRGSQILGSPPGDSNFDMPNRSKNSKYRPDVSNFKGKGIGVSRRFERLYMKDVSRLNSGTVISYKRPPMLHRSTHKYQGFDQGRSQRGDKLFFRDLSKIKSGYVINVTPPKMQHQFTHKYQGFDKGRSRLGDKLFYRDLSNLKSGYVINYKPTVMEHQFTHKYQGFDKGRSRLGNKLFFRDLSKLKSGLVVKVNFPSTNLNYVYDFKGFDKGRTQFGNNVHFRRLSKQKSGLVVKTTVIDKDHNNTHKYQGFAKRPSELGLILQGRGDERKQANFTSNYKIAKRSSKMHPSATYLWGKKTSTPAQKEMLRKINVLWVRVNGNKVQPDAVTDQVKKPKFDKKEKDLWNY